MVRYLAPSHRDFPSSPGYPNMSISQFNQACLELYQPKLNLNTYASRSFRFLSQLVPAEFIAFGSLQVKKQNLSIDLNESVSNFAQVMPRFGELMHQYDLFRWDPTVNAGKPFTTSDFFSARQFKQLDIYEEVFKTLGVTNHYSSPATATKLTFSASSAKAR